jgi:TatD DNase family protein
MPVIIHERDCVADCLEIVLDYNVRGVFHAFSGSKETAKILLDRGWYISFPGTVTFKNAKQPVENAVFVPEDRILTETDSPYLTAHPFRGKRNDSGYMRYTIEKIAELRGISFEELERITEDNAKRLFRL